MGYQVNRVFLDDGQSGVKLERPGLGGLIVFCVLHPELVSAVFVKGYDRLARDIKQLVTIHDRLQSMNIAIYAGEQSSAFATNKFAFGVVKMMADYERSVRAERAQHGKHHKKSN
jgi:DNA invertase Pin-like site-specific DNA recombinase